jgi:diacylglycerol O-acyltransferase
LYRHGARLVHLISMGPLVDGLGVNFTGWSYVDEMTIAVMGCRDVVPDVWDLATGLRTSLDELLAAATVNPGASLMPK